MARPLDRIPGPFTVIVFYISGHGFGHVSRDVEVINALLALEPDLDIAVRTSAPRWLVELTVRGVVRYEHVESDTGIVQLDSLRLDEAETVRRAAAFMDAFPGRVAAEAAWLRAHDVRLVVADIPPLGVAAAAAAALPVAALGNFSWDWIYAAYAGTGSIVRDIREVSSRADVALRLPLQGGFQSFRHVIDVPFIARHSARNPRDTRQALDLPLDEKIVLVSFGGYGVDGIDLDSLSELEGYLALVSANVPFGPYGRPLAETGRRGSLLPIEESALYASGFRYEDLVRAVDVVLTKPGYGIVAECLANETALLYTSRGHFVEYDVIVQAMPHFLKSAFIEQKDLFAARWAPWLDALLGQPTPKKRPPTNGAEVAATLLLEMID